MATYCDTSDVTYSGTVLPILQAYCYGCHSSSGTGGGILLSGYSLMKSRVDNGKLRGAINRQPGFS